MWSKILNNNNPVTITATTQITQNTYDLGEITTWNVGNTAKILEYHNLNHVEEMYQFLEDEGVEYYEELDYGVLFHDSIYDNLPNKEERSAEFFRQTIANYPIPGLDVELVCSLIMATKDHVYTTPASSDIIRADLHGLSKMNTTIRNYGRILQESMNLYEITEQEFAQANIAFMENLQDTIFHNIGYDDSIHSDFYYEVLNGIKLTIFLSKLYLGDKLETTIKGLL